ncbi:hypothetical protein [Burkholderia multivorans]|uniref:hypothetical protein n=1 Tax=Burkholderia multivorans TaxID=87883 RepID=UPI001F14AF06|nr:hypothetical protein [Burkholderia multivorans]
MPRSQHRLQFVDVDSGSLRVKHGVAVRAYGSKVSAGVYFILRADARDLSKMMHVDKSAPHVTVGFLKVETTNVARRSPMSNAGGSGAWITFVLVDKHLPRRTFDERTVRGVVQQNFVRVDGRDSDWQPRGIPFMKHSFLSASAAPNRFKIFDVCPESRQRFIKAIFWKIRV